MANRFWIKAALLFTFAAAISGSPILALSFAADEEKKELESKEKSKALSFEDLTEYSKALELYDKGKKDDAKKIAEKITNKYPAFEPVKNLLKKL